MCLQCAPLSKFSHHVLSDSQPLERTSRDQLYNYSGWFVESRKQQGGCNNINTNDGGKKN